MNAKSPHPLSPWILALAGMALWLAASPAGAACNPCSASFGVKVKYIQNGTTQQTVLTGSMQVFDGVLDLDLGPVQSLLTAQAGNAATLAEVVEIALNGNPPGQPLGMSDVLLAKSGDVVAWVDSPNGGAARLHASTLLTQAQQHPFSYVFSARGTESPPVDFSYTLSAKGDETYRAPAHHEEKIKIEHYDPNKAECREIEGDVCLPPGCKRTSSRLDEYSSSHKLDYKFHDVGDRCAHFRIQVSSTNLRKKDCNGNRINCSLCGAWYEGIVVLDGTCDAQRSWTRSASGTGKAEASPRQDFTVTYSAAGGALGSGLAGTAGLFGTPLYMPLVTGCTAGGVPVSCSHLGVSMNGETLTVSTAYTQTVSASKPGNDTLSSADGLKLFTSLPFTAENGDVQHFAEVTFQGRTYRDANSDGFVDVGAFSVWTAGPGNDQLWGSFDRSGIPAATIDSIAPNPALTGQTVQFLGHGSGNFTSYEWHTHRQDQTGGPLLAAAASFSRNDLRAGLHQIRFRVSGSNPSPFTYAFLAVNQPPVAFINHVENTVDPAHPSVALLLRDGALPDPFELDGSGLDADGSIAAYEWTSDLEPGGVIGTSAQLQRSLTALGTHTVSLRVRDDAGVWSVPVKRTVTVRRPPVLLVHGLCGDKDSWSDVVAKSWLGPQWQSADVVRRTFDPNGDGKTNDSPSAIAQLVRQEIQGMKQLYGVRTVNVLTHSMGGLSARAYLQGPAFQGDVNKLVMLGPPNHGSSLADLSLLTNGYSPEDVELYIPVPKVKEALSTLGLIVDVLDAADLADGLVCLGEDSDALHALRPHSTFLRNLNRTHEDEGTEDFGGTSEPADTISPYTEYFVVDGTGLTLSHTHLPDWLKKAVLVATKGSVNLTHMELAWLRTGDGVVTDQSAHLDGVPGQEAGARHRKLQHNADAVAKALFYLLDDPPPPARPAGANEQLLGAHLLGADRGLLAAPAATSPARTLEVDAAARRLRVGLSWEEGEGRTAHIPQPAPERLRRRGPSVTLVLTSPSGVRYESGSPGNGFEVTANGRTIEATLERPEPGNWTAEITAQSAVPLTYLWLAGEETGTFLSLGLSADRTAPGEPVKLAAYLHKDGTGVTGAAVHAAVAPPAGRPATVSFTEDPRYPGLYVAGVVPDVTGIHRVLAAAEIPGPAGTNVTRVGFVNFEARALPDLTISLSASTRSPRHGEPVRLTAEVANRGKGSAKTIPVRFFEGVPREGGRLLAERTIDLPATGTAAAAVTVSVPWLAQAGAHRLVAIVDPENLSGEADLSDNTARLELLVPDDQPPVARAGADQVAAVGQNVVLDGRASTDDDRIASYRWDMPAPAPAPASATTATARARSRTASVLNGGYAVLPRGFPVPGIYTVRLTVTDRSGNSATDDLTIQVVTAFDDQSPVASAGPDLKVLAGAPVRFDGTGSRDNYGITRATWDLNLARDSDGDGKPANDADLTGLSPVLERGYERPGTYRVRLTVSDTVGNPEATDDLLVTVGRPAAQCTLTLPPGADANRALALASRGDTICLEPGRYTTAVVISTPGLTLEGQGAVLERTGRRVLDLTPGVEVRLPADSPGDAGVTVRNLTVRGFPVGFSLASGGTTLEGNRTESCASGFVVGGTANRLVGNSARGGASGILLNGDRHVLERNESCGNSEVDIALARDVGAMAPSQGNVCDKANGFSDAQGKGCSYRCNDPRHPFDEQFSLDPEIPSPASFNNSN